MHQYGTRMQIRLMLLQCNSTVLYISLLFQKQYNNWQTKGLLPDSFSRHCHHIHFQLHVKRLEMPIEARHWIGPLQNT